MYSVYVPLGERTELKMKSRKSLNVPSILHVYRVDIRTYICVHVILARTCLVNCTRKNRITSLGEGENRDFLRRRRTVTEPNDYLSADFFFRGTC